jgi:hypothetical protein
MEVLLLTVTKTLAVRLWAGPPGSECSSALTGDVPSKCMMQENGAYNSGFPQDDPPPEPPTEPARPFPTDVPAPEPHDVPAPEPIDVPPPEPGEDPTPAEPKQGPKPRPFP